MSSAEFSAPPPPPPPPPPFFNTTSIVPPPPPPPPPAFFNTTSAVPPPPPPPPSFNITSAVPSASVSQPPSVATNVTSSSTQDRVWLHPWTSSELRANASNWSLAGDAGLLLYLEEFSDKLVQRANNIQQHLNQTVNAVKSTHIRVQNCLNEFTSLANTQFIENRVYDEDETVDTSTSKKEESNEKTNTNNAEAEEKILQRYVDILQRGLSILDTHFERIETKLGTIHNGVSYDDDDDDGGISNEPIIEPKDQYALRPLPFIIGTGEFMQDDYIGLGDLLVVNEEESYGVEAVHEPDIDSVLSSSDEEDDGFEATVIATPSIVPAGASRPDHINPTTTKAPMQISDEDDDDDDIFGMNAGPKFDVASSKVQEPTKDSNKVLLKNKSDAEEEEDDDDDAKFGITSKTATSVTDSQSRVPKQSEEPEEKRPIEGVSIFAGGKEGMSALQAAIAARRKKANYDSDSDDQKDAWDSSTPSQSIPASQSTPKAANNTDNITRPSIFNTKTQPTTFDDNDDDNSLFSEKLTTKPIISTAAQKPTVIPTVPTAKTTEKKEKDIFDNETDDEDVFGTKRLPQKSVPNLPKPPSNVRRTESTSSDDDLFSSKTNIKTLPTSVQKPPSNNENPVSNIKSVVVPSLPIVSKANENSDDEFFGTTKPKQQIPKIEEKKPVTQLPERTSKQLDDSDEELFGVTKAKPQMPKVDEKKTVNKLPESNIKKKDSDEEPFGMPIGKPQMPKVEEKVSKSKLSEQNFKKDDESDEELFGTTKTKPQIPKIEEKKSVTQLPERTSKKLDDSDEELFGSTKAKPKVEEKVSNKKLPERIVKNDDNSDEELFGTTKTKPQIPKIEEKKPVTQLPQRTGKKMDDSDDELFGTTKSKTQTPKSEEKKAANKTLETSATKEDDSDTESFGISTNKTKTTKEKSQNTPSVVTPVVPPTLPVSKSAESKKNLSDSDDESFTPKRQINASALKDDEKPNVLNLAKTLAINPNAFRPGSRPKPSPAREESVQSPPEKTKSANELNLDSDDDDGLFKKKEKKTPTPSPALDENKIETTSATTVTEQTSVDKTMINILKSRAKVVNRTRAPPSRTPRSHATTSNETDDLFGSSNLSTPIMSVTGLQEKTVAHAAKPNECAKSTQKKKFSLFDSDDSDTEELLFGVKKKTNSSVVSKPVTKSSPIASEPTPAPPSTAVSATTTATTTKTSTIPLDNDDLDFRAKRPIKKTAKTSPDDDIFADVSVKAKPANKAKKDWSIMNKTTTDDTDDIFTEKSTKTLTTPKSTTAKSKLGKDVDDIFADPLNVTSKP